MKSYITIVSIALLMCSLSFSLAQAKENDVEGQSDKQATSLPVRNDESEYRDKSTSTTYSDDKENDVDNDTATSTSQGDEHKSDVAKFVKKLLEVAGTHKGIGEEVRVIAREQASSSERVSQAVKEIEDRNIFKTFFVGADYKNVGMIRSEIAQTQNRLNKLDKELQKIASSTDKDTLLIEKKRLEDEEKKLSDFVTVHEDTFSLFGWFVKLFQ